MADRKVSIIGAGNVGSTLGMRVWESGLADVVLVDIYKSMAEGKAMDILDSSGITGSDNSIIGTDDYSKIKDSQVIVITAGFPRKPGMSREELVSKNASIVKEAAAKIKSMAPDAVIIVVTNPLDAMTYLVYKTGPFRRQKVIGMAGELDGSRFMTLISRELKVSVSKIKAVMMGSHGDTMVPVISQTTVGGKKLDSLLAKDKIESLVGVTRSRGAQIVGLLGSGSAYYSPSASAFKMVKAVLSDSKETVTASILLEGEYGISGICLGVPVKLGKDGVESVVELALTSDEKSALMKSAEAVRETIRELP